MECKRRVRRRTPTTDSLCCLAFQTPWIKVFGTGDETVERSRCIIGIFCHLSRAMSIVLISVMTAIFVALVPGILFKFPKQGSTLQVALVHGGLFVVAYILASRFFSNKLEGFAATTCPPGFSSFNGFCISKCAPRLNTVTAADGSINCQCPNGKSPNMCGSPICGCPAGMSTSSTGLCQCPTGSSFDSIQGKCVTTCSGGMISVPSKFGKSCICDPAAGLVFDAKQNKCVTDCSSGTTPLKDPGNGQFFCAPASI